MFGFSTRFYLSRVRKVRRSGSQLYASTDSTKPKKSLAGSVKPYTRHLIVCGCGQSSLWPSKIENSTTFVSRLIRLVDDTKISGLKITAVEEPNSIGPEFNDIIVYPENKIFRVSDSNLESFVGILKDTHISDTENIFQTLSPSWKALILVCVHGTRDKRCGRAGPQVIESMKEKITKMEGQKIGTNDIKVMPSSHIGGHEFAGTLIVFPQGDWYGQVTGKGEAIDGILSTITDIEDSASSTKNACNVYEKCWRGNAGMCK